MEEEVESLESMGGELSNDPLQCVCEREREREEISCLSFPLYVPLTFCCRAFS